MASNMAPESRHQNRHQTYKIQYGGRLNSERNLPVEDPWHKDEEASEMKTVAVAQWQGQQLPECLGVSGAGRTTSYWPDVAGSPMRRGPW